MRSSGVRAVAAGRGGAAPAPRASKRRPGGAPFQFGAVEVGEGLAGVGDAQARACPFVRCAQLAPFSGGTTQSHQCGGRVAHGEEDGTGRECGVGPQQRGAELGGDGGQFVGGGAGALDIAGGEKDLGRGTQHTGTGDGLLGFGEQASELRGGDVDAALREPQQRHPGLGLASERVGTFVGVLSEP